MSELRPSYKISDMRKVLLYVCQYGPQQRFAGKFSIADIETDTRNSRTNSVVSLMDPGRCCREEC